MAAFLVRRNAAPVLTGLAAAVLVLPADAYAEAPDTTRRPRKPIYDNPTNTAGELPTDTSPASSSPSPTSSQAQQTITSAQQQLSRTESTLTDRLANQIKHARLALYSASSRAEAAFDETVSKALNVENSIASTIRGLAPPADAHEPLLPGAAYVLVATLSGSIITRNRGIFLRLLVPTAIGVGVARVVLPRTSGNVGRLLEGWEERVSPELVKAQREAWERAERFVRTSREHTVMGVGMLEDKVGEAREKVEGWVRGEK